MIIPSERWSDVHYNGSSSGYVLVTAAYNEEKHIEKTIDSVLAQSMLPNRWVIVSDGSTDRTDEIIRKYAGDCSFVRFVKIDRNPGRCFGSKVRAIHAGNALLKDVPYDFIGNLDADVSVSPSYFEELISRLKARPAFGIAGGYVVEEVDGQFQDRRQNRVYSVAHAAQIVRRECYEAIGGYAVLEYGGEDWHAQISAKMKGWDSESFPDLKVYHHRHTGEADNLLRHRFRQGRMDYSLGSDGLFEIFKCALRIKEKPLLVGWIARLLGFAWSWIRRDQRPVSQEFVAFLRQEQRQRISALVGFPRSPKLEEQQ